MLTYKVVEIVETGNGSALVAESGPVLEHRTARFQETESMTMNTRTQEKNSDDGGHLGRAIRTCLVGIDGDGCEHVFHVDANQVVVSDGRRIDYRQPLDERPLGDWMEHVKEARGWQRTGPFAPAACKADAARKRGGER